MKRGCIILSVFLFLLPAAICGAASKLNVDFFLGWDGCYRPMKWTPVEIGISSSKLTRSFDGYVTVTAQQDGLNTLSLTHEFVLTADLPLHLPLVTKLAYNTDTCSVRVSDKRGKTHWQHNFQLWDYSVNSTALRLTALGKNDLLVGLIGARKFGILRLADHSQCRSKAGIGKVYLKEKLPRMVPWDWTGFASLDLLVLYDPDWTLLRQDQLEAIAQWVTNGGKLLLVLSGRPLTPDNPIHRLLPFELGKAIELELSTESLQKMKLDTSKSHKIACQPLTPKPNARFYQAPRADGEHCLFGTGLTGFGRVGVLAFDPSLLNAAELSRKQQAQFWVHHFAMVLQGKPIEDLTLNELNEKETENRNRRRNLEVYRESLLRTIQFVENTNENLTNSQSRYSQFVIGPELAASNELMNYLYSMKEMRPLSIWWVVLLLGSLALLLGPVDYIMLKRLDRLELTWLTSAVWLVLFSVGAYYGVQLLRGGNMQIRVVSVVDGVAGTAGGWSTSYLGVFAPRSDKYQLTGLAEKQWWSGAAPTEERIYSYRQQRSIQKIYYSQHDGANLPHPLPINIWTVQCLLNESPTQSLPIQATLQRQGDEITLKIENRDAFPIKKGYVRFDNNMRFNFGTVPAKSTISFQGRLQKGKGWKLDQNSYRDRYRYDEPMENFESETIYLAQGCLQRTEMIRDYLAKGAAVVCAAYDQADSPFSIMGRRSVDQHIRLARLVVIPEILQEEPVQ